MGWWFLILSVALARPSAEVLDDLERWEDGADRLLDGPVGCWQIRGVVTQELVVRQPPDLFSGPRRASLTNRGPLTGRMRDGRWEEMEVSVERIASEGRFAKRDFEVEIDTVPLVGRHVRETPGEVSEGESATSDDTAQVEVAAGGGDVSMAVGRSVNLMRRALEHSESAETVFSRWDEERGAVVLEREVSLGKNDRRTVQVRAIFPDGGEQAMRIDAVWPRSIHAGRWPFRVRVRDAQMHVLGARVGERVFPWEESLSFSIGVLGYDVGYEQHVQYTHAQRCEEVSGEGGAPAE